MRSIIFCVLVFVVQSSVLSSNFAQEEQLAITNPTVDQLEWLAGSWFEIGGDKVTEEHWIEPSGGIMLAVNRTTNGKKSVFEFLRIQKVKGRIVYFASPSGRPPIEFTMTKLGKSTVTFENRDHDFPRKITYSRVNSSLHVELEGVANGQIRKTEWVWKRKD